MKSILAAILLATCVFALAEDITTLKGKTYTNCTVTLVEDDGITITYDAGAKRIPFTDLPEAIRAQYGYDPVKAKAAQARRAAAKQQQSRSVQVAAALDRQKQLSERADSDASYQQITADLEAKKGIGPKKRYSLRITQVLGDGEYLAEGGPLGKGDRGWSNTYKVIGIKPTQHDSKYIVDGDTWVGWLYDSGPYNFGGSTTTVRLLRATP